MNPQSDRIPRPRASNSEDMDERGRYLYPGDVEDALPEGNWARWLANYLLETILRVVVVRERDSVYANLPIYFVKGEPGKHVSPDAFYLPGVPYDEDLVSYRLWETGVVPRVVFEILSRGSELKDRVANRRIYESLGVPEYYWFEPKTRVLEALELDSATRVYRERKPNSQGRYTSTALGLDVAVEGKAIALYREGEYLAPTEQLLAEAERQREAETRRREEAERRLADAEARVKDLERRLGEDRAR